MIKDASETALSLAAKLPDILRSARSGSLIEYSDPTRVEALALLDDRVVNLSFMPQIMQTLNGILTAYYLQAVHLSINVGRVNVVQLFDKVNPNRNLDDSVVDGLTNAALRADMQSRDPYEFALPRPGQTTGVSTYGMEAARNWGAYDAVTGDGDEEDDKASGVVSSKDSIKYAREVNNLAVGHMVEVEVEDSGAKAVFPINIRLMPSAAPSKGVVHTLSLGQKNRTTKERWHAWRAGQLRFVQDMVLCQDILDDHKKGLMHDVTNMHEKSTARKRRNVLSALFSGQPSVATASNIVVIADQTRKELERELGGRLKDFRTREKMFKATYTMLLAVIDPEYELITIYHRSISQPSEMSVSEAKQVSGGSKGPDVQEILKAYTLGNSPSL